MPLEKHEDFEQNCDESAECLIPSLFQVHTQRGKSA